MPKEQLFRINNRWVNAAEFRKMSGRDKKESDISKLKKDELIALAEEKGIDIPEDAKKDELIELLK